MVLTVASAKAIFESPAYTKMSIISPKYADLLFHN